MVSLLAGQFQSTPVIANGRIDAEDDAGVGDELFQSTPVIANGRIRVDLSKLPMPQLFQSTPVIANGRIADDWGLYSLDGGFQSTPVIANGRIPVRSVTPLPPSCFNPRPLLLTGESCSPRDFC